MSLRNILPFGKSSELLVCETDGFSLRAAVVKRNGIRVDVIHHVQSELSDMAEAIKDIVSQLESKGWKGKETILLSPAVLSTLVELPVDPKKPRPLAQMQELVRWEVEPLLMQHTTQWTVGHLLVGQGYMSADQAQTVMDMQQGKVSPSGELELSDNLSLRRFGDLAVELKYIRRSQLNACLAGQEWLKSDDEAIACGWTPQAEIDDVPGMFGWLVSCVNQGLLERWQHAFEAQGLKLKSMYPLTASSTPLANYGKGSTVLIESHKGMACITRIADGNVTAQYQYVNPEKSNLDICLESYHALNVTSSELIQVGSWHDDSQLLADELQSALAQDVDLLSKQVSNDNISFGMLGAAYHAYKLSGYELNSDVRIGGPLPPVMQRQSTRFVLALGMLTIVLGASEMGIFLYKHQVTTHKSEIDAQWKVIDDAIKSVNARKGKIEQRKKELAEQEKEHQRLHALVEFYDTDIPDREALVQGVLGVLQTVVSEDVMIKSIDELGKRVPMVAPSKTKTVRQNKMIEVENFNIEAWALSETAAQNFIQSFKQAIAPYKLQVKDPQVMARLGPLNLDGFTVVLRVVKQASLDSMQAKKVVQR